MSTLLNIPIAGKIPVWFGSGNLLQLRPVTRLGTGRAGCGIPDGISSGR